MSFKDGRKRRGLYLAEVSRRVQVSPNVVRVTVCGDDLRRLPHHGFDQWFRLFLPRGDVATDFSRLPDRFDMGGYAKFMRTQARVRPVVRNYTAREFRPAAGELDIDFVVHGDRGIAGPWAAAAERGAQVAILDQGRGYDLLPNTDFHLLVSDESGMPAIVGILRDLPEDARGLAIIEIPHVEDAQDVARPEGIDLHWLPRTGANSIPGARALEALRDFVPETPRTLSAYVVGEQTLATQGRRHLVAAGVPKSRIAFIGYWRVGKAYT